MSKANHTMALELDGLCKSFGGLRVIHNVSFSVPQGGRVALIGPNGAGKTTIFNLISGVYGIDAGLILVNGQNITQVASRHRVKYGVARSFQNIRLMQHLTVIENLLLGQHVQIAGFFNYIRPFRFQQAHPWRQQAMDALARAGLAEYAEETVNTLPYGLRKRVDLVRALEANPKILMLDEPAAGLNPAETHELQRELERISQNGVALLVVEHDMQFIRNFCDQTVVLNFGEKIAEGSMSQISQNEMVKEAYLGTTDNGGADHVG